MAFAFERLLVSPKVKVIDLADQVYQETEHFPRPYDSLADQLHRAALSITTNLAESNGHFTISDRKNFLGI